MLRTDKATLGDGVIEVTTKSGSKYTVTCKDGAYTLTGENKANDNFESIAGQSIPLSGLLPNPPVVGAPVTFFPTADADVRRNYPFIRTSRVMEVKLKDAA